jgi:lycopene cyclase domain-containing protein
MPVRSSAAPRPSGSDGPAVGHYAYLLVLAALLLCALWLEPVLRVNVLRRWRRLLLTLVPVVVVFALWDLAAIAAGHWTFDPEQTTGVLLPGGLPIEELLFFVAVPICTILGFEAVRAVNRWPAGDEPAPVPGGGDRPEPAPGARTRERA